MGESFVSTRFAIFLCIVAFSLIAIIVFGDVVQFSSRLRAENNLEIVQVPRVVAVTFQKDEFDILEEWLSYHAALFGADNIVVLDNFSKRDDVLTTLKHWESRGTKVHYGSGPYRDKGRLVLEAAKSFPRSFDILLPVDIDEFLVFYEDNNLFASKRLVLHELEKFWFSEYNILGLQPYFTSKLLSLNDTFHTINHAAISFYSEYNCKKLCKFFQSSVTRIDHGNHNMDVVNAHKNYTRSLGYLHYHYRSPSRVVERAIHDCIGFGYLPENTTLANIRQYTDIVMNLTNTASGYHKVAQVKGYLQHGLSTFLYNPAGREVLVKIPTITELIRNLTIVD